MSNEKIKNGQVAEGFAEFVEDYNEALRAEETIEGCVEHLMADGYRKERYAEWEIDESYQGKQKVIYKCTRCGHWQSAKKNEDKVMYMNFCPFCGALMRKPEERKEKNEKDR